MERAAEALLKDFLETDKHADTINYFRKTAYSYLTWLLVLDKYFKKEKLTIEQIEKEVNKIASRKTLYNFLDHAIEKKYFFKIKDPDDKRKSLIQPATQVIADFEKWVKYFRQKIS